MLKMETDDMSNADQLCADWIKAKREETAAQSRRQAIEVQLEQAFEVPTEGSKTQKTEKHKVTVTQPVSRKLDVDAWEKVKGKIPMHLHPVKTKIEADAAGCKYLLDKMPQSWAMIAAAFTVKPGKVGFKVEEV